jgi:hypothetical protein
VSYVYNSYISTCTWRSLLMQENYTKILISSTRRQVDVAGPTWAPPNLPRCHVGTLPCHRSMGTPLEVIPSVDPSRCTIKGQKEASHGLLTHHLTIVDQMHKNHPYPHFTSPGGPPHRRCRAQPSVRHRSAPTPGHPAPMSGPSTSTDFQHASMNLR